MTVHRNGCSCNPPCVLQVIRKATKHQLQEWLINEMTGREMAEAYYPTLESHLRKRHRCKHDFADVAEEAA